MTYGRKRTTTEFGNISSPREYHLLDIQKISNPPQIIASKIGMCTENVNLDFLERDIEQEIFRNISVDPDDRAPWLVSSLDGMTDETHTPCEAKHTSESNTFERIARKCYPQLQHYLMHTQKDYIYLSVLFGNKKYLYAAIDADNKYCGSPAGCQHILFTQAS